MYNILSLPKLVSARVTVDKIKNFNGQPSSLVDLMLFFISETAQLNSGRLCVIASK